MAHRECRERDYRRRLAAHGLVVSDAVSYDLTVAVFPLDRWFPRPSVRVTRALERVGSDRSERWGPDLCS